MSVDESTSVFRRNGFSNLELAIRHRGDVHELDPTDHDRLHEFPSILALYRFFETHQTEFLKEGVPQRIGCEWLWFLNKYW